MVWYSVSGMRKRNHAVVLQVAVHEQSPLTSMETRSSKVQDTTIHGPRVSLADVAAIAIHLSAYLREEAPGQTQIAANKAANNTVCHKFCHSRWLTDSAREVSKFGSCSFRICKSKLNEWQSKAKCPSCALIPEGDEEEDEMQHQKDYKDLAQKDSPKNPETKQTAQATATATASATCLASTGSKEGKEVIPGQQGEVPEAKTTCTGEQLEISNTSNTSKTLPSLGTDTTLPSSHVKQATLDIGPSDVVLKSWQDESATPNKIGLILVEDAMDLVPQPEPVQRQTRYDCSLPLRANTWSPSLEPNASYSYSEGIEFDEPDVFEQRPETASETGDAGETDSHLLEPSLAHSIVVVHPEDYLQKVPV